MQKKISVKVPKHILVVFSNKKKIITFLGPACIKSFKLDLKINILGNLNIIEVTNKPFVRKSNSNKKQLKSNQGTTVALLKQMMLETTSLVYKKLKIVGVGYRSLAIESFKNKLFIFKLGYSHSLYFKTPNELKFLSLKATKLYVYGSSYQEVTRMASVIRLYKKPEPYKGKGILYESERIKLKEGKKI
jgi:large subunit ribosomal protein L6